MKNNGSQRLKLRLHGRKQRGNGMTPIMPQKVYVKDGGTHCPVCGSDNISAGDTNYSAAILRQQVKCLDCKAQWNDVYELKSYELLEHSTSKQPT